MKLTTFGKLSLMAAAAFAFTGCNDSNDKLDTIIEYNFASCYAAVTDLHTGATSVSSPVSIVSLANWNKANAVINISGLYIGSAIYPQLTLEGGHWSMDKDAVWNTISGNVVSSIATGAPVSVSDLNIDWTDRLDLVPGISMTYAPALEFSFTIDNRYKVTGSRSPYIYGGKTVSTPKGGKGYESEVTLYTINLDFATRQAAINIKNANFAQGMPALNMEFAAIPFTVDADANITLDKDALIPSINGVPQPSYPISNLHAELTPGKGQGSELNFTCNFRGQMEFNVTASLDALGFDAYFNQFE